MKRDLLRVSEDDLVVALVGTPPAVSVSEVSCREGDECGARTCMVVVYAGEYINIECSEMSVEK